MIFITFALNDKIFISSLDGRISNDLESAWNLQIH